MTLRRTYTLGRVALTLWDASHLHSGTRRTQNSTMCEYYTNPRFSDRTLVTLGA